MGSPQSGVSGKGFEGNLLSSKGLLADTVPWGQRYKTGGVSPFSGGFPPAFFGGANFVGFLNRRRVLSPFLGREASHSLDATKNLLGGPKRISTPKRGW